MKPVITAEEARKITGGRTPLVPVVYEQAISALVACTQIDEAKTWSDKADALAAWARIYRNDEVGRNAARLKLHAYRRMGELARELRPERRVAGRVDNGKLTGQAPGAVALLKDQGLNRNQATAASALAQLPREDFSRLTDRPRPPGIYAVHRLRASGSDAWKRFNGVDTSSAPAHFRSWSKANDARAIAAGLAPDERKRAREIARDCIEWLDAFDQALPKDIDGTATPGNEDRLG